MFYEKHEPPFVFKSLTVKGSSCHGFFDEWMVIKPSLLPIAGRCSVNGLQEDSPMESE